MEKNDIKILVVEETFLILLQMFRGSTFMVEKLWEMIASVQKYKEQSQTRPYFPILPSFAQKLGSIGKYGRANFTENPQEYTLL